MYLTTPLPSEENWGGRGCMGKPVVKLSNKSTSFWAGEGKEEERVEGRG